MSTPPNHKRGYPRGDPKDWLAYEKIRDTKSPRVRLLEDRLVRQHGALARHWMDRYLARTRLECDRDDAWQAAQIGLLRAMRTYDRNRAVRKDRGAGLFAAWVRIYVWRELWTIACQAQGRRPKDPSPLTAEEYRRVAAFELEHGREALAEDVGVSEEDMRNYRMLPKFEPLPDDLAYEVDYDSSIDMKKRLGVW
jgi:hypothetical protein